MTSYLPLDIYLRLSDLRLDDMNDQGQSVGLVFHEKQLRELGTRLGVAIGDVITENDIIDGKPKPASAWKRKTITLADGTKVKRVVRPGFTRVLDRVKNKQSGGFLAIDLDRVVRDPRDLEDLIDTVAAAKANVHSLTGSLRFTNGGTADEQVQARITLAIAFKSSADTSRRVASARERQAQSGIWHGGKRPYGYELDGRTTRKSEADEIRSATRKILADISLRSIVQDMRDRGVPTVKGGAWTTSALKDILMRPRNAGIVVYQGKEIPAEAGWEAIVTEDELRAVSSKLTVRKAKPGRAARWLGSSIYLCTCKGKMAAHAQTGRAARYRCKDTGLMGGRHTSRVAESLDRFVEDLVIDWAAQPVAVKRLLPSDEWRDIDVADLRQQQATAKARLEEKIRVNFERPDQVTDEQLYVFTELTNKRIIEIDQILAKALPQSPTLALAEAAGTSTDLAERRKKVRTLWEKYSLGTKRAIIRELVIIRLLPAPSGKHFDSRTVEVTWNL